MGHERAGARPHFPQWLVAMPRGRLRVPHGPPHAALSALDGPSLSPRQSAQTAWPPPFGRRRSDGRRQWIGHGRRRLGRNRGSGPAAEARRKLGLEEAGSGRAVPPTALAATARGHGSPAPAAARRPATAVQSPAGPPCLARLPASPPRPQASPFRRLKAFLTDRPLRPLVVDLRSLPAGVRLRHILAALQQCSPGSAGRAGPLGHVSLGPAKGGPTNGALAKRGGPQWRATRLATAGATCWRG